MSIFRWIGCRLARESRQVETINAPTDIHLVCDGEVETVTLRGNLFQCAWGMKGIRQANPEFVERWLDTDDVNESRVMLQRPATIPVRDVFIRRGTPITAQLIPDATLPPSKGHMDLINQKATHNGSTT